MVKRYELDCPVAYTLDIVGERWTLLVIRDLFLEGPCRYQDFKERLTGISPTVLSDRLKTLEANGIVERRLYTDHPPRAEYSLTSKGRELGPVLKAMREWGTRNKKS